jgi:hypothetical protein
MATRELKTMHVTNIFLNGYRAIVENNSKGLDLGTVGSRGNEKLNIIRGDGWEDLEIKITFWPSRVEVYVPDNDGLVEIPWEATDFICPPFQGKLVFNGISDNRVLNTTDLTYSVAPHSPTTGIDTKSPTPSVWEQWAKEVKSTTEDVNDSVKNISILIEEVNQLKKEYEDLISNATINSD